MTGQVRRPVRELNTTKVESHKRFLLSNRPWEQDLLHWAHDGQGWQLHGQLPPPAGRRRSTTRTGWCSGRLQQAARADATNSRPNRY